jgi:hypothetical protein
MTKEQDYYKLPDWVFNEDGKIYASRKIAASKVSKMNKLARKNKVKIRFFIKNKTGKIPYTNFPKIYFEIRSKR